MRPEINMEIVQKIAEKINSEEFVQLLLRCSRLIEEVNSDAPTLIIETECKLINKAIEPVIKQLKKYKNQLAKQMK